MHIIEKTFIAVSFSAAFSELAYCLFRTIILLTV